MLNKEPQPCGATRMRTRMIFSGRRRVEERPFPRDGPFFLPVASLSSLSMPGGALYD